MLACDGNFRRLLSNVLTNPAVTLLHKIIELEDDSVAVHWFGVSHLPLLAACPCD